MKIIVLKKEKKLSFILEEYQKTKEDIISELNEKKLENKAKPIKLKEKHSNLLKDILELTEIKKDLEKKIEEEKPKNEIKDFPKVISFNKGPIIPPSSSSDMFYKKVEDVPKEISFNKGSTIPPPPPPPPPPGTFFKTNSNY